MQELTELSAQACRTFLGTSGRGRIVFTEDSLPAVASTRYVVWGDRLWFPTPARSALRHHRDGDVLAYHVDHVEVDAEAAIGDGWSVTVLGGCRAAPPGARPQAVEEFCPQPGGPVLALDMVQFTGRLLSARPIPPPRTD
ncbi:pyridoxamine 5'-phosphate oxidase family protein [Kineococcus sp. SYSU DK003]|uniref:pyridoxamine 5'-phosphate oxidase family protein n=1 Tax=Kineococcus sp. SYSU DK003 TaxID=3383124 RepID=UPI003D7C6C94